MEAWAVVIGKISSPMSVCGHRPHLNPTPQQPPQPQPPQPPHQTLAQPPQPPQPPATSAAAATSAPTSAASAASATAAASPGKLYGGLGCSDIFLVEDIERSQADIRDFLFTESYFVARCGVLRRRIRCGHLDCRGCAARQRQRQSGSPQQRHGACSTSLRNLLRARHGGILPYLAWANVGPIDRMRSAIVSLV